VSAARPGPSRRGPPRRGPAPIARRFLAGCAVLAATACASAPTNEILSAEEEFRLGQEAFAGGRFADAAEHFNRLVLNYPGSEHVVEARYLLGRANFQNEEYPSAAQDFERFQQEFPADSLADDALYWAGRSYEAESLKPQLDQADTQRAISSYTELLRQYRASSLAEDAGQRIDRLRDRLAEKEYQNARYYFRQRRWKALEIYVRALIEEYPQSNFVAPAYLMLVRAYEAQGREEEAERIRETLREQFPESPEAAEVGGPARPSSEVLLQAGGCALSARRACRG
jgi:outer membrane protein assembly factor BamD